MRLNAYPIVKLSSITDKVDYGLTASASDRPEGPRFLRITDLQNDRVNWNEVPSCECSPTDVIKFSLNIGDIVFARTGATTGKSFLIRELPEQSVFASYLIRVRPKAAVDPLYLSYFFRSDVYWTQIRSMAEGAAQPGVNSSKLKELKVPLPPLAEQKRIAAILDKADALRRKRQQAIDLADQFLRSVFLDMFGDPVTNPKGWEVMTAGECIQKGLIHSIQDGNHGNDHPKVADFSQDGLPFIAANVVRNGKIQFDKCYYLSDKWLDKLRIGFAKPRDVLLTHKGTLGLTAVMDDTYPIYIFSPQTTYYRLNGAEILPEYLKGYFDTEYFQRLLEKEGKQSTRAYIGITRQKELPILVPSIDVQIKYVELAEQVKQKVSKYSLHDRACEELFSSISQQAFSGQL